MTANRIKKLQYIYTYTIYCERIRFTKKMARKNRVPKSRGLDRFRGGENRRLTNWSHLLTLSSGILATKFNYARVRQGRCVWKSSEENHLIIIELHTRRVTQERWPFLSSVRASFFFTHFARCHRLLNTKRKGEGQRDNSLRKHISSLWQMKKMLIVTLKLERVLYKNTHAQL